MSRSSPEVSEGVVEVDHRLISINRPDLMRSAESGFDHHLLNVSEVGIDILVGRWGGPVAVKIEVWDAEPPLELEAWDCVAECSFRGTADRLMVIGAFGDVTEFPVLTDLVTVENFRVRASIRGRDLHYDLIADTPDEALVLQVWRSPPAPFADVKVDDRIGREWVRLRTST